MLKQLASSGLNFSDARLSTPTDIDRRGRYHREWLIATNDGFGVFDEEGKSPAPVYAFADSSEIRVEAGVGSGLLIARLDGADVPLLRFSNREAFRFERVAHILEKHRTGEPIELHPGDEVDPRRCPHCGMTLEEPGEPCAHCIDKRVVVKRMARLLTPYTRQTALMLLLLLIGIALDLVSPQLTRYLVDNVLPGSPEAAQRLQTDSIEMGRHVRLLLIVVAVLMVVQALRMIANIGSGRLASKVGSSLTFDMRGLLVDRLQQLSLGFYDRQQVGSLVGRVAYDTEALHDFVWQLTGGFLLQLLMVIGVGAMMFSIDARLALCALLPAPFVIGGTVFFWRRIYPRYAHLWDASSRQSGGLAGMLSGIRVVKSFNQEPREMERFHASSEYLRSVRYGVDRSVSTFNPIVGVVFQMGGWIVWFVGGREVLRGELTLGELMAFFGYLWMFYGPLAALPQFTNWLTRFVTQANRIFEILDTPAGIADPDDPVPMPDMRGDIEFENVVFGYHRHEPVIRNVSFQIDAGEMVGIVGSSGSGKTTLINLLCRFYDVDDGSVRIDGIDVRHVRKGELRNQIGVVLQEAFLFRGAIHDNIAYGRPDASPEEVIAVAAAANCHDFVLRQAHGYDTWLGERGSGLSGGERQRLSIARVLLTNPRVLVLDEATSSVDAESEAAVQRALQQVVRGRTTIAIAHRLSTLRMADRLFVIERGRLVETGTHAELVALDGVYARYLRLQNRGAATTNEVEDDPEPMNVEVRWLEPSHASVHLGSFGALHLTVANERIYPGVYALRSMPVHYPAQFISMRHVDSRGVDREIGMIRDLAEWPAESRRLIEESLQLRYLIHTVRSVNQIEAVGPYLNFQFETDLGPANVTVRVEGERIQRYGRKGVLLIDTDENRFLIPDLNDLPERDQRLYRRHVYW